MQSKMHTQHVTWVQIQTTALTFRYKPFHDAIKPIDKAKYLLLKHYTLDFTVYRHSNKSLIAQPKPDPASSYIDCRQTEFLFMNAGEVNIACHPAFTL